MLKLETAWLGLLEEKRQAGFMSYEIIFLLLQNISTKFDTPHGKKRHQNLSISVKSFLVLLMESAIADNIAFRNFDFIWKNKLKNAIYNHQV